MPGIYRKRSAKGASLSLLQSIGFADQAQADIIDSPVEPVAVTGVLMAPSRWVMPRPVSYHFSAWPAVRAGSLGDVAVHLVKAQGFPA